MRGELGGESSRIVQRMASRNEAVFNFSLGVSNENDVIRAAQELRHYQWKIGDVIDTLLAKPKVETVPGFAATRDDFKIAKSIERVISLRDKRASLFAEDLFADPAWDVLLELFLASLYQRRVSVSRACAAARVPPTTALRWLKILEEREWVYRQADPKDARRVFICLTERALRHMREFANGLESDKVRQSF